MTPQAELTRREVLKGSTGVSAALATGSWFETQPASAATPKPGGTFRINGYAPRSFDMHLDMTYRTQTTVSLIYNKLFRFQSGPDIPIGRMVLEGDLVESWAQLDKVTYLFKLHEGVRWHDKPPVNGRELVASDVKYSLERFLIVPGNAFRSRLEMIDTVAVVNPYTVKVILKRPYVWFLDQLASAMYPAIVAREVVETHGDLNKPEAAIGTGPWILETYEPDMQATFVRHPDYFRNGMPYADTVEWIVITDQATRQSAYRAGKFDFGWRLLHTIQLDELTRLQPQHPDWVYKPFLWSTVDRLTFRLDRQDLPFHDIRVRRAISLGIDRQGMLDVLNQGQGAMSTAIPPALIDWALAIDELGPAAENSSTCVYSAVTSACGACRPYSPMPKADKSRP